MPCLLVYSLGLLCFHWCDVHLMLGMTVFVLRFNLYITIAPLWLLFWRNFFQNPPLGFSFPFIDVYCRCTFFFFSWSLASCFFFSMSLWVTPRVHQLSSWFFILYFWSSLYSICLICWITSSRIGRLYGVLLGPYDPNLLLKFLKNWAANIVWVFMLSTWMGKTSRWVRDPHITQLPTRLHRWPRLMTMIVIQHEEKLQIRPKEQERSWNHISMKACVGIELKFKKFFIIFIRHHTDSVWLSPKG